MSIHLQKKRSLIVYVQQDPISVPRVYCRKYECVCGLCAMSIAMVGKINKASVFHTDHIRLFHTVRTYLPGRFLLVL